jgi:hypothetical protein
MWQPGESKPEAASDPMDVNADTVELGEATPKGKGSKNTPVGSLQKGTPPSSSKKLSGTTMNMRFMQRKAEEKKQQEESKRRRSAGSMAVDQVVSPKRPQHTNDDGEDDDDDDDMSDDDEDDDETGTPAFQVAGTEDMYGPQAHVLGRRSFGGFNRPMEEASKSFHGSEDPLDGNNKKPKVSDDELLKRYEVYVKNGRQREGAARPVGNLQNKRKAKSPAGAKRPAKR